MRHSSLPCSCIERKAVEVNTNEKGSWVLKSEDQKRVYKAQQVNSLQKETAIWNATPAITLALTHFLYMHWPSHAWCCLQAHSSSLHEGFWSVIIMNTTKYPVTLPKSTSCCCLDNDTGLSKQEEVFVLFFTLALTADNGRHPLGPRKWQIYRKTESHQLCPH